MQNFIRAWKPTNELALLYCQHLRVLIAFCEHPQGVGYNVRSTINSCVVAVLTSPQLYICPSASADELFINLCREYFVAGTRGKVCSSTGHLTGGFDYKIFCVFTDILFQIYFCERQWEIFINTSVAFTVPYLTTQRPAHICVSQLYTGISQTPWLVAPKTEVLLTVIVEKVGNLFTRNPAGQ
jgi:hypothetical protein